MKRVLVVAAILIAGAIPAQAQMGRGGYGGAGAYGGGPIIPDGAKQIPRESSGPRDPEGHAEDLRVAGHCDQAVPIFRSLINSPRDFPITKYNLGLCLLDLAAADKDAAQADAQRTEGAMWIVRAANGGFNMAQAKAVELYLDGVGVKPDPVEAEKWALIFHRNGMRLALGLPDISSDLRDRLDNTLSDAQYAQAEARANAWVRPVKRIDN